MRFQPRFVHHRNAGRPGAEPIRPAPAGRRRGRPPEFAGCEAWSARGAVILPLRLGFELLDRLVGLELVGQLPQVSQPAPPPLLSLAVGGAQGLLGLVEAGDQHFGPRQVAKLLDELDRRLGFAPGDRRANAGRQHSRRAARSTRPSSTSSRAISISSRPPASAKGSETSLVSPGTIGRRARISSPRRTSSTRSVSRPPGPTTTIP